MSSRSRIAERDDSCEMPESATDREQVLLCLEVTSGLEGESLRPGQEEQIIEIVFAQKGLLVLGRPRSGKAVTSLAAALLAVQEARSGTSRDAMTVLLY